MKKRNKIAIASILGIGALALIVIPTATVLALNNNNTHKDVNDTNGIISLVAKSNDNTNSYTTTLFQTSNDETLTNVPLSVIASYYGDGSTSLTYQWYAGKVDSSSAIPINKATSSSYSPSINTNDTGSYYYYVKVSNGNVSATSKQFVINVISGSYNVNFTSNTTNNKVVFNTSGTAYLNVSGLSFNIGNSSYTNSTYALTYQWEGAVSNGNSISKTSMATTKDDTTSSSTNSSDSTLTWTPISGATTLSLALTKATNTYTYYHLVATGTYDGATFSITSPSYSVTFSTIPGSVYVYSGNNINSMSVPLNEGSYQTLTLNDTNLDLSNYTDISYQWYVNDKAITEANSPTYTLASNDVSSAGSYAYTCVITALDGKKTATFTSSAFTVNVISATPTAKLANNTTNAAWVTNGNWAYDYLVLPNSSNLPVIYFKPNLTSLAGLDSQINTSYTFYFVNTSDPNLSTSINQSSPYLAFNGNWMKTYGLTAGTTYQIIGTFTVSLNGVALNNVSLTNNAPTTSINGTTLTFPANSFLATTSYFISIGTTSTPTLSINKNSSTTASDPQIVTLNSSGSATATVSTSIVFDGLLGLKGNSSGLTSSLNDGYATFTNILTKQVLNTNSSISGEYTNVVINDGVMSYSTSVSSGLTSITVSATNNDTLNEESLSNTTYSSVVNINSQSFTTNGYVSIEYANQTQADENLTHLWTNPTFSWDAFTTYFNNQANNNYGALNQWMYNILSNVAFGNNLVQTAGSSSWVKISSIQQNVSGNLPNSGWGISISNSYPSYLTGTSVSIIASGTTLPFSSSATNYQTLLLTSSLNFNTFSIGNNGSQISSSKYLSYTGSTLKGVLSFYVPFDYMTPSSISNSSVIWNAVSSNTNFGFTITDTVHPWTMLDQHTEVVKQSLQGFYFAYNSNMNSNLANYPLTLNHKNDSVIPNYNIAKSVS